MKDFDGNVINYDTKNKAEAFKGSLDGLYSFFFKATLEVKGGENNA